MCISNNLVALVRGSSHGQLASLERLLGMLIEGDYITGSVIKSLWDTFQQSTADSALAVQVLSMVASSSPTIINNNFDLLVRTGLSTTTTNATGNVCIYHSATLLPLSVHYVII